MDKICAVVDIQGFQFKSEFVPRELAIVAQDFSLCVEVDAGREFNDLSQNEKQVAIYTTKNLNGLHLYPFNDKNFAYVLPSNKICQYVEKLYQLIGSEQQPFIAVKSKQTMDILKSTNVALIDLNDPKLEFPKFRDIQLEYGYNYLCGYHKKPSTASEQIFTCAYRKSAQLFRKIREINVLEDMVCE